MQIVAAGDIGDEIEERILQFLIVIQYGRIAPNFEAALHSPRVGRKAGILARMPFLFPIKHLDVRLALTHYVPGHG